eukprot:2694514-Rhodomonas_salina.1
MLPPSTAIGSSASSSPFLCPPPPFEFLSLSLYHAQNNLSSFSYTAQQQTRRMQPLNKTQALTSTTGRREGGGAAIMPNVQREESQSERGRGGGGGREQEGRDWSRRDCGYKTCRQIGQICESGSGAHWGSYRSRF